MADEAKKNIVYRALKVVGLHKGYGKPLALVIGGYYLGGLIDRHDTIALSMFRDKSAMYGPDHKEGDPPSWPRWNILLS